MLIPLKIIRIHPSMMFENERKLEKHLETASRYHVNEATPLNEGKYEKATLNARQAQKYMDTASKTTKEKIN